MVYTSNIYYLVIHMNIYFSRLGLYLPNKVESKQSKAKWISDKEELHITLLLQREYDFINLNSTM